MKPICLFMAAFAACFSSANTAPRLKVGDPAPRLAFGECFKGHGVKRLERGHVYVIDFWATGCPPCVAAIPHISHLAKSYKGEVTFTGVSVQKWPGGQQNDTPAKVASFLKTTQGKAMRYNVLADTPNGFMVNTWFDAAGFDSIPVCFVVGKNGRIAWMGDPMALDSVLRREVSGS